MFKYDNFNIINNSWTLLNQPFRVKEAKAERSHAVYAKRLKDREITALEITMKPYASILSRRIRCVS